MKRLIQNPRTKKRLERIGKIIGTILLIGLLTALIFTCIFAVYVRDILSKQAEFDAQDMAMNQTSIIYYQNPETGEWEELQKLYAGENRIWASYDELPKNLLNACVAIEDKRFYEHHGFDFVTTGQAGLRLFLGQGSAGGSTITQQLIKNLTGDQEITVRRKIIEIFRALEFEKTHSKEEVLEWYMNVIYLGEGCFGVRSASQVYFGKDVSELTLAECASLIGITNNPSLYDPYLNRENNLKRQRIILGEMLDQEMITQEEYDAAIAQELVFTSGEDEDDSDSGYYSYFVDQVIRDVISELQEQLGQSEAIAEKLLYGGGYKIYCTLNPTVQQAVDDVYTDLDKIPNTTSRQQLQSAMVIIDNQSGDVVAIAGGVGEKEGSLTLSRATQTMRSPGSTIKPITVYSPALDLGVITPISVYDDTPFSFGGGKGYPKNQNNTYRGLTTVEYAVGQSLNTIPVKIVDQLGPEYCYTFAKENMGLSTLVSDVEIYGKTYTDAAIAPMAMGGLTRGVTVRDMTNAYATIAGGGYYREARTFTRIEDSEGRLVLEKEQPAHTAMKSSAAWYMTNLLHNATISGTSTSAKLSGIAVAAKTGTTSSNYDRWFAAFTPYYTGVVWCGFDEQEEVVLSGSSMNPALNLWKQVMTVVHEDLPSRDFPRPGNVVSVSYCLDSGLLATEACRHDPRGSRVASALLYQSDAPTTYCDVHENVQICEESGEVATDYCAMYEGVTLKTVGLLNVRRAYPIPGITVSDQAYVTPSAANEAPASGYFAAAAPSSSPYHQYCSVHTAPPIPEAQEEPEPEPYPAETTQTTAEEPHVDR
ncbi:MAG: transglycosylase domain-containing protein [Oscillospiraceae bacterium]|nr:transglycosylase domain-containing protein [Oscillospiraceae bacterium]